MAEIAKKLIPLLAGSLCFWSWNDFLEKNEIKRQLEDFAKGCFSGVIIHSRAGLRIEYMGEEWFQIYRFAVEEAKRLGLEVWIYDEDGWPSGFAGGIVPALGDEYKSKQLVFVTAKDEKYENIIAAFRKSADGYHLVNSEEIIAGDLVCYCEYTQNYVDVLSKKTIRAFIDATHEKYKSELGEYFGTVIKGVFTDEPQHMLNPWNFDMPRLWEERYGSNLKEQLYLLYVDCDLSKKFRIKYQRLVSDMFYEAYTKQINDWCEDNSLYLTGHFGAEDGLVDQMTINSGVMRHYDAMGVPGIDHLGNRITSPVLCKQVASVANQLSRPEVLSETFGCAGWEVSFKNLAWIWGSQSVMGVTKPCYHLSAYSMTGRRKRDYPAFFSYHEPWWEEFSEFQKWMDGLNELMKEGKREVNTLVLSPLSSVAANYKTSKAINVSAQYRLLLENLLDSQLDFELGDETLISKYGKINEQKFVVGDCSYNLVIVPFAESYSEKTFELLWEFKKQGGTVWYVGERPQLVDFEKEEYPKGLVVQNRTQEIEKAIAATGIDRAVSLYEPFGSKIKHNAVIHTRDSGASKRVHIWTNEDFCSGDTKVSFKVDSADYSISLVDPADNSRKPLNATYDGEMLSVIVDITNASNIVIELNQGKQSSKVNALFDEIVKVRDVSVKLCEPNAITLDYAAFSFENGEFSEYKPIVQNIQWLYETVQKECVSHTMSISLKYHFNCGDGVDLSTISTVIENEFVKRIEVNSISVDTLSECWWIDRKFSEYRIGRLLKTGENEIVLSYEIPKVEATTHTGFESDRNRFFLPIEPESIYIKGDFDVETTGTISNCGKFYRVDGDDFKLVPFTNKTLGDITAQNSWFYRGNVEYSFYIEKEELDEKVYLKSVDTSGMAAVIKCGDKKKFVYEFDSFVDISDLLKIGNNQVSFQLQGSNRNLLGPHHHMNGVVAMVGPSTFAGTKGFEDFVSANVTMDSTWTNQYSFIPFGAKGFYVAKQF